MLVDYQRRRQCRGGCPIGSIGAEVAENNPEARLAVASGYLRWEAAIRAGLDTSAPSAPWRSPWTPSSTASNR